MWIVYIEGYGIKSNSFKSIAVQIFNYIGTTRVYPFIPVQEQVLLLLVQRFL